jgi:molecular chaperone GrpE
MSKKDTEPHEAAPPQEQGLEQLEAKIAELEDRWKRALAETDNLRKRLAKDLATGQEAERRRVTAAWLPIVDNLELALAHADKADPIVTGVKAVRDQALDLLAALGYPRDDETGIGFDPVRHEAVSVMPGGGEPGTVVSVVRPGYGKAEHQLRPAAVVVAGEQQDS